MREVTSLDIEENISALTIAILRKDVKDSEHAFRLLNNQRATRGDVKRKEEIFKMFESGMSAKEISQVTGIKASTIYTYVCKYRKSLRNS